MYFNVAIPYVPDVTESLQRLFRSHGINTYVKPQNTIRSLLVARKDKANKLDKLYQIACKECTFAYVGERLVPDHLRFTSMNTLDPPPQSANIRPLSDTI